MVWVERPTVSAPLVCETCANSTDHLPVRYSDLLVKLVLSLLSMSFSVLAGLVGLLSSNHPKSIHLHHLFASLLCFFIPWYTVKLCSDLLANAIDTMFVCFNVDLERGSCHSNKAKEAFLGSAEERA